MRIMKVHGASLIALLIKHIKVQYTCSECIEPMGWSEPERNASVIALLNEHVCGQA